MQHLTRKSILSHLLRSVTYTKPTYYVSWAQKSGETEAITEIGGIGYARQLLVTNDASWAFNSTTRILDNAILLTYNFNEDWLYLDSWSLPAVRQTRYLDIYSALTGGDLLWRIECIFTYGDDGTSVTFQIGDFNIGFVMIERS